MGRKLPSDQVQKIKQLIEQNTSDSQIAHIMNITPQCVNRYRKKIRKGEYEHNNYQKKSLNQDLSDYIKFEITKQMEHYVKMINYDQGNQNVIKRKYEELTTIIYKIIDKHLQQDLECCRHLKKNYKNYDNKQNKKGRLQIKLRKYFQKLVQGGENFNINQIQEEHQKNNYNKQKLTGSSFNSINQNDQDNIQSNFHQVINYNLNQNQEDDQERNFELQNQNDDYQQSNQVYYQKEFMIVEQTSTQLKQNQQCQTIENNIDSNDELDDYSFGQQL